MSDPLTDARAARRALERLLETAATAGITLPAGFTDAVERYVALLLDANARLNLTRITDPEAVARLHLLDALAGLAVVDALAPRRALDLGSGGGIPGIVLAMARPEIDWVLTDSVRKKAEALRAFASELRLGNVQVVADRAETLGRDPLHREAYELVTARALAALPVLVEYALPLLATGGSLLAWKGPIGDDELAAGSGATSQLGGGSPRVRPTGIAALGDHRFVLVRKDRPTPARYPRRPGEASRRPLR